MPDRYNLITNVPYYENDMPKSGNLEYLDERCRLDIYYPETAALAPTVLFFHGGGLSGGVIQHRRFRRFAAGDRGFRRRFFARVERCHRRRHKRAAGTFDRPRRLAVVHPAGNGLHIRGW